MKKIVLGLLVLISIVAFSSKSFAWFWNKDNAEKPVTGKDNAAAVSKPAAGSELKADKSKKETNKPKIETDKARIESDKAKRALVEQKRKEINNTEWTIELSQLNGKGRKETESVSFKANQVVVSGYSKRGFQSTNYSLSIQGDGTFVWETMQTSEKSGIAFWRGEISADMQSMRGVLSHQINDKNREEYSFVSTAKKIIPVE